MTRTSPATRTGYAFFDAAGCGGVVGPGTSNVFVSTQNPACKVNFANRDYANWDAFADANPDYRTSPGWTPFIIADRRAPTS
jgi:hypothetical protein